MSVGCLASTRELSLGKDLVPNKKGFKYGAPPPPFFLLVQDSLSRHWDNFKKKFVRVVGANKKPCIVVGKERCCNAINASLLLALLD